MSTSVAGYGSVTKRRIRYALIILFLLAVIFPVYWMVISSIKPTGSIFSNPPRLIPREVTLVHYREMITDPLLWRWLMNSVIVSSVATVGSVILSVLAGYGWAKFEFKGSRLSSTLVIASRTFPIVVILVPMFQILKTFGLINTHPGLIISYFVYTLPLTAWMLKGFFENIPQNVIRAARIDGMSELQVFYEVSLPIVRPGIVATALFSFVIAWQELLFAITFIQSEELYTLPVALLSMSNRYNLEWGQLMATSFLFMAPVGLLFIFAQKYFIAGLTGQSVDD